MQSHIKFLDMKHLLMYILNLITLLKFTKFTYPITCPALKNPCKYLTYRGLWNMFEVPSGLVTMIDNQFVTLTNSLLGW